MKGKGMQEQMRGKRVERREKMAEARGFNKKKKRGKNQRRISSWRKDEDEE